MDERRLFIERDHSLLSIRQQCELLGVNRSTLYYTPRPDVLNDQQIALMRLVDEIYTKYPFLEPEK